MQDLIRRFDSISNRQVLYLLCGIAFMSFAISAIFHWWSGEGNWQLWANFAFQNFGSEMLGALMIFALIEILVGARTKRDLLAMQSRANDAETSKSAVDLIIERGWVNVTNLHNANLKSANFQGVRLKQALLEDANLKEANLENVILAGANLRHAELQAANLNYSDLSGANLTGANLESASISNSLLSNTMLVASILQDVNLAQSNLESANLENAHLENASLRDANLESTSFKDANLKSVDMRGANFLDTHLEGANLKGANLENASWLAVYMTFETILPDGTYWKDSTDMMRFIDPAHPDFWKQTDSIIETDNEVETREPRQAAEK